MIREQIDKHGLDAGLFQQIDRMTKFCDFVAFDFCLEKATEGQVEVFGATPAPSLGLCATGSTGVRSPSIPGRCRLRRSWLSRGLSARRLS